MSYFGDMKIELTGQDSERTTHRDALKQCLDAAAVAFHNKAVELGSSAYTEVGHLQVPATGHKVQALTPTVSVPWVREESAHEFVTLHVGGHFSTPQPASAAPEPPS